MKKETLVVGIDSGEDEDLAATTSMCGSCNTILDATTTKNNDTTQIKVHKICPYCGAYLKYMYGTIK